MKTFSIPTLLMLVFVLTSCKKNQTSDQPKETVDRSIIKSMVILYDQGINFSDKSGMTVTLENSNPVVSTVTDAMGMFSLKVDTALHSFTLVYTKPSYGTYKEFYTRSNDSLYVYQGEYSDRQVKAFIEPGQSTSPNLGQKSTVTINSLQVGPVINGQLNLNCNVSGSGAVQIFYQKNTPITSFASIPKSIRNTAGSFWVTNGNNTIEVNMNVFYGQTLGDMHTGDIAYITAYGNAYFAGAYLDRVTNQMVLPNINLTTNAAPVSFVIP